MSLNKNLFKKIYQAHVYVGIFVAIHFCIFSLSGLALLFKDELQNENQKHKSVSLTKAQVADHYATIFEKMRKQHPNDLPLALFPDDEDHNIINGRLGIDQSSKLRGARKTIFTLSTAEELKTVKRNTDGFFDWMLELHRELFLGSKGKLYVGFIGFLYVFILISGFYIYGKFMKTRIFGDVRKMRLPKLIDLHKFIGVVTFGWSLIVGLSGVFLAFNSVLIKLFQFQSLKHLSNQYASHSEVLNSPITSSSFAKAVLAALQAKADYFVSYISFPNTEFGIPGHYLFLINGTTPLTEKISQLVVVNAQSSKLIQIVDLPLYLKVVLLSEPLHFGNYGGLFLKIVWALFTLASLTVVLLGIFSFLKKRSQNKPQVKSTVKRPPRKNWIFKSTYTFPVVVGVTTLVGLPTSLFSTGLTAMIANVLVAIPLFVLLLARRENG